MPLAMSSIITMAENTESIVDISYYEVYMDRCYDLLEPKNKEIPVLEDSEGRVQLSGGVYPYKSARGHSCENELSLHIWACSLQQSDIYTPLPGLFSAVFISPLIRCIRRVSYVYLLVSVLVKLWLLKYSNVGPV